jgi:hypothetical protein
MFKLWTTEYVDECVPYGNDIYEKWEMEILFACSRHTMFETYTLYFATHFKNMLAIIMKQKNGTKFYHRYFLVFD